jgi:hypothetical protein
MVSIQPITNSYVEEVESCYFPCVNKVYKKGGIMDILMIQSPLFVYLCQFNGTCFAPGKEYSKKYFKYFYNNIDHLSARKIVLSSLLRAPMSNGQLKREEYLPTLYRYYDLEFTFNDNSLYINRYLKVIKSDLKCNNGILHLLNGMIDFEVWNNY